MATATLFSHTAPKAPLAERLRPKTLAEVVGQESVVGPEGVLTRLIAGGHMPSLIFWGPPGCGKTTIARLLAKQIDCEWMTLSAVTSGVSDLKAAFEKAARFRQDGKRTLLFVDEIHRFNRAQQDAFLPVVEDGTIILVGATTENPSFELNGAVLSRCRVVVLSRLTEDDLIQLMHRAEEEVGHALPLVQEARVILARLADGDGRYVLNLAEELFALHMQDPLTAEEILAFVQKRAALYDKSQESHYNLISALHKSMRGSDVDAALYWFCRMLDGGEDPRYIGRRLVRFASEDIGMADPQALLVAEAGINTYERLGSPEGELALAQVVVHLATAPKSNAIYKAFGAAMRDAKAEGSLMPPKHILNAPTKLMKELGYSEGYAYDHSTDEGFSGQNYFPDGMVQQEYYHPVERGFEREIIKRLDYWKQLREKKS
ncbi:MAG: replication-associated recombination protein A [Rickettsiales bacterium]